MGELVKLYKNKRKNFGRPCNFEDSELKIVGAVMQDPELMKNYIPRNPTTTVIDNIPELSEHSVNTERTVLAHKPMSHTEGGWPKEIDYQEAHETTKWRTRQLKE
jgi:dynein intermediate chain 2